MSDTIGLNVESSGADGVERIISSIDKLTTTMATLASSGMASLRKLEEVMAQMSASTATNLAEIVALTTRGTEAARAAREKGNDKITQQQKAWEDKQHANANKFHDRQLEIDIAAENRRAGKLQGLIEKRDLEEYAMRSSASAKLQGLIEKRDLEEYATRSSASAKLQGLIEKRDLEEYATRSSASAKLQGLIEKRDLEEYAMRSSASAKLQGLIEKRDLEEYAMRSSASAKLQGLIEKRDLEEYATRSSAAAKLKAAIEQQQAELYAIRAAAQEKQRALDTAFITSSLAQQIAAAEKAKVYASLGGNATAKYGSGAATADLAALKAQHDALHPAIQRNTEATRTHGDAMNEAHALARGLAGSLGGLWLTYGSMAPLLAGAAIAASLKNIVTVGKEVEYQLKFVEALGGSKVNLDDFLSVTDQTVVSVKEAAGGMRALAQNGLNAVDSLRALPSVLNLAVIGEMGVEQAALSATGAMSAFGLQLGDLGRVGDIFAQTAATSNTSVAAMTESMKQASTVAAIYGSTIEETAGALGVLAKVNITGSAAGTAYTNMLTNLYTPTEKAKKALAELRITTDDGAGGLKNSTQLLKELRNELSKYSASAQATFLGDIFTVRGQKGASTILDNFDAYISKVEDAKNASGYMSAAVAKLEDTVEGASRHLQNSFGASLVEAFTSSQPALQEMIMNLAHVARSESTVKTLTALADAALRLTTVFVDHVGTIVAVVAAYTGLRVVAALPVMLAAVDKALTALTLSMRSAISVLGWLGLAIAAVTIAYELFIDKTTDVEKADTRIRNSIQTTIEYLERETDALNKRNAARAPQADAAGGPSAAYIKELQERVDTAQGALAAKSGGFSPASVSAEYATLTKLQAELADAKRQQWKETALADSLAEGLSIERFEKEKSATLDQIARLVAKGQVEKTIAGETIAVDAQGNAKSRAIALSAVAISDQLLKGKLSQKEASTELLSLERKYSEALQSRAPKEKSDHKGPNDRLNAAIALNAEESKLLAIRQKTALLRLEQENSSGGLGDVSYLEAKAKFAHDSAQAKVDEARANIDLVEGMKNKAAATQKFKTAEKMAIEENAQIDIRLGIDKSAVYKRQQDEDLKYQQKTLQDQGKNQEAFLMGYEAEYGTHIAGLVDEMVNGNDKAARESAARAIIYLDKLKQAGREAAGFKDLQDGFTQAFDGIGNRITELVQRSSEGSGLGAIFYNAQAAQDLYASNLDSLLAKQRAVQAAAKTPEQQKAASADLAKINAEAAKIRGIWADLGKEIGKSLTEAFGKGGTAIGGLLTASLSYATKKKQIDDDLALASPEKRAEAEVQASYYAASAQIKSYGDMSTAAKGFFSENTAGYRAMQGAEKAFRLFELTMALQTNLAKSGMLEAFTGLFISSKVVETAAAEASVAPDVAASMAKGQAAAAAGVATQAQGDPYSAWARMAAMAAVMVGLGFAVSGGGGGADTTAKDRQDLAGVGSVLGDSNTDPSKGPLGAKSDSIAKSLAVLEKNSGLGLVHSSAMVSSLHQLVDGISGLAAVVAQSFGPGKGVTGITPGTAVMGGTAGLAAGTIAGGVGGAAAGTYYGMAAGSVGGPIGMAIGAVIGAAIGFIASKLTNVKTTIVDQGIALDKTTLQQVSEQGVTGSAYADVNTKKSFIGIGYSNKTNRSTAGLAPEVEQQFTSVINALGQGVDAAVTVLGVKNAEYIQKMKDFPVEIGDISFKDLTPEQIQKQFEAIFSKLGDEMARAGVDGLKEFQQAGEGSFATLTRVANNLVQTRDVFAVLGQTLAGTGMTAVRTSEDLIKAAGGMENLTGGTKAFIEGFLTDGERLAPVAASVAARMDELHLSSITTAEQFKKQVLAQDLNTEAGREMYAALIAVAPGFKAVTDAADKVTEIRRGLGIELMSAQGDTKGATAATRTQELLDLSKSDPASVKTKQAIYDATDAKSLSTSKRTLEIELMTAQGRTLAATAATREDELAALTKANPELAKMKQGIYAAADALSLATSKRGLEIDLLNAQGNSAGALALTREDELAALFKINPELSKMKQRVYDAADALTFSSAKRGLEIDLLNAQGNAAGALALTRADELTALGKINPELVKWKQNIYDATDALALSKANQAVENEILDITGDKISALGRARAAEKVGLDASTLALIESRNALQDQAAAAEAARTEATNAVAVVKRAADAEKERLNAAYKAETDKIKTATDKAKAAATAVKSLVDAIEKVSDKLKKALLAATVQGPDFDMQQRREAQALIERAVITTKGGGTSEIAGLDDALTALAKPSDVLFSTFEEYARDQGRTSAALTALQANAKAEINFASKTVDGLENTVDAIEKASKAHLDKLETEHTAAIAKQDAIISKAQEQLDVALGTNVAIMSVADALKLLATSLKKVEDTPAPLSVEGLYQQVLGRAADPIGKAFWEKAYGSSVDNTERADFIKAAQPELQAKANGTLNDWLATHGVPGYTATSGPNTGTPAPGQTPSITTVSDLYQQVLGRQGDPSGLAFWTQAYGPSVDDREAADFIRAAQPEIAAKANGTLNEFLRAHKVPGYAVGTNFVPNDGLAMIHQGERIVPAADNRLLMSYLSGIGRKSDDTAAMEAAIIELAKIVRLQQEALDKIERNTRRQVDLTDVLTEGGVAMRTKSV